MPGAQDDEMTLDDALMWLNDHLGERVVVTVKIDKAVTLLWNSGSFAIGVPTRIPRVMCHSSRVRTRSGLTRLETPASI